MTPKIKEQNFEHLLGDYDCEFIIEERILCEEDRQSFQNWKNQFLVERIGERESVNRLFTCFQFFIAEHPNGDHNISQKMFLQLLTKSIRVSKAQDGSLLAQNCELKNY